MDTIVGWLFAHLMLVMMPEIIFEEIGTQLHSIIYGEMCALVKEDDDAITTRK